MDWQQLFRKKSIDVLLKEMAGEHRLHRVLGPISLTSLGVGAIIGAGIFAMTGRVAAEDAGPAIMLSFIVAGVACMLAAFCYSEFASMAPVAGSAYTYTYATLGELWAWIIGWDLILEYSMACAVVASHWAHYLNELLKISFNISIPAQLMSDPFTGDAYFNLPAVIIMAIITAILVLGIRESAITNAVLVIVKVVVVLFVIGLGINYVSPANWTRVPVEQRRYSDIRDYLHRNPQVAELLPAGAIGASTTGEQLLDQHSELNRLPAQDRELIKKLPSEMKKWGLLGLLGFKDMLQPFDESLRSPFMPYGFSGLMVGAAIVFFAFIGFDSISTHSEEAIRPQRDVPFGILASLGLCTVLYMAVSAVITGMEPYPQIDTNAAVAAAFRKQAAAQNSGLLHASAWLISIGALAGMTSVLLVTFLSQARIFLAMARDGLLPQSIFGVVHPRFRTPHRATILTGVIICLVAGFTPIRLLEEMVSIGTLMAFVLVCASVLQLRISQPKLERPFRCPALGIVAPLGVLVNLSMMLFLPLDTWLRLVIWLGLGMVLYFCYGFWNSRMRGALEYELKAHGMGGSDAPLDT